MSLTHYRRSLTALSASVAAMLAAALLVVTFAGSAPVRASAEKASTPAAAEPSYARKGKPTIVLVHGAWADSSGWYDTARELKSRGYPVIALSNPLRGLSSDAAYIRSALQTINGPVVLVAHSYGGAVITGAASGLANVKALVYVAAFVPEEGEAVGQLAAMNPGSLIDNDALVARPFVQGDGGGVDLYIKAKVFRKAFAADLPARTTRLMQITQRPLSGAALEEPAGAAAWETIPSWYLLATQDKTIPPRTQKFMARRAGAKIQKVRSSHVAMQSNPRATTALILKAARSTR